MKAVDFVVTRLVSLGAIVTLSAWLTGCATFSEPVAVGVKNDLSEQVSVRICKSSTCTQTADDWTLKPNGTAYANVEVNAGYTPAVVVNAAGAQIGCLPFRLHVRPTAAPTVAVSQAVPCGLDGGVHAAAGKDWPDTNL